jgi:hypothetical protein
MKRRDFIVTCLSSLTTSYFKSVDDDQSLSRRFSCDYFNKFLSYGPGTMNREHGKMLDEMMELPVESVAGAIIYFEYLESEKFSNLQRKTTSDYMAVYFRALLKAHPELESFLKKSNNKNLKSSIDKAAKD